MFIVVKSQGNVTAGKRNTFLVLKEWWQQTARQIAGFFLSRGLPRMMGIEWFLQQR